MTDGRYYRKETNLTQIYHKSIIRVAFIRLAKLLIINSKPLTINSHRVALIGLAPSTLNLHHNTNF